MIEWLWNNKEWIFSGIGVAVVLALVPAARWLMRRRISQSDLPPGTTLQAVIDSPPPPPPALLVETSSLDPQAIIKAIESAPLLQQGDIEKHYRGMRVEWTGELISAKKRNKGEVTLLILCGSRSSFSPGVMFDIDPAEYPGLGLLRSRDSIRVSGVIRKVEHQIIELKDVRLLAYGNRAI
jgi:hypothetical protein